ACKNVHVAGHLQVGPGHRRIAGLVLAFIGIDVPLVPAGEGVKGLVRIAIAAFNRYVPDVDGVVHGGSLPQGTKLAHGLQPSPGVQMNPMPTHSALLLAFLLGIAVGSPTVAQASEPDTTEFAEEVSVGY